MQSDTPWTTRQVISFWATLTKNHSDQSFCKQDKENFNRKSQKRVSQTTENEKKEKKETAKESNKKRKKTEVCKSKDITTEVTCAKEERHKADPQEVLWV